MGPGEVEEVPASVSARTRRAVHLFLLVFALTGLAHLEVFPFSGFRLFSELRSDERVSWQLRAVDAAGEESPIRLSDLPVGYRNSTKLLPGFADLPARRAGRHLRRVGRTGAAPRVRRWRRCGSTRSCRASTPTRRRPSAGSPTRAGRRRDRGRAPRRRARRRLDLRGRGGRPGSHDAGDDRCAPLPAPRHRSLPGPGRPAGGALPPGVVPLLARRGPPGRRAGRHPGRGGRGRARWP